MSVDEREKHHSVAMDEKCSPKATEFEEKKVERDPSVGSLNRTEVLVAFSAHL